jgi:UDP-N-acetylglucosamine acyltransferase
MAYAHVGHDCNIGDHVILVNSVQLAGHVEIGDYAIIGGLSGARQFTRIGAHTYVAGHTVIRKDVPPYVKAAREPMSYMG